MSIKETVQKDMNKIVIMNFSNVYTEETFYKNEHIEWIDCTDIKGSDCFCDEEASATISRKIQHLQPQGIHFIDSGNYHYISKFFTDKIQEDFILVVFDHHPDMQPSLFDELLTCGSWVKAALDTNRHLKKVLLIGTSDDLLKKNRAQISGQNHRIQGITAGRPSSLAGLLFHTPEPAHLHLYRQRCPGHWRRQDQLGPRKNNPTGTEKTSAHSAQA